ncbi:hypothetical protein N9R79_09080 [Vibrio sp.]|nr:hypothetical protein [Vibrio sp.]
MMKIIYKQRQQLSKQDIPFVILPHIHTHYVQSSYNIAALMRELPLQLQQRLGMNEYMTKQQFIAEMSSQLTQGQWFALTPDREQSDITTMELHRYPQLQQHLLMASGFSTRPMRSAAYDPVEPAVTDIDAVSYYEASPDSIEDDVDYKIVVEIAGRAPHRGYDFVLSKTRSQYEKLSAPKKDTKYRHRSLVEFSALKQEPRNLSMRIPLSQQKQYILLPLAKGVSPVSDKEQQSPWNITLVPFVPILEQSDAFSALDTGYVYVLWNDRLWRELEVTPKGEFKDVDLAYHRFNEKAERKGTFYCDILFFDEEHSLYAEYQPIEISANGKHIHSANLNEHGFYQLFGLPEGDLDVTIKDWPEEGMKTSKTFPVFPADAIAASASQRPSEGSPNDHIVVPAKVNGDSQQISVFYSLTTLSTAQLQELESGQIEGLTRLNFDEYLNKQSFSSTGSLRTLPTLTNSDSPAYRHVAEQTRYEIPCAVTTNASPSIQIQYKMDNSVDDLHDALVLREDDGEWEQVVRLLRSPTIEQIDDQGKLIEVTFSGWPSSVKTASLYRRNDVSSTTWTEDVILGSRSLLTPWDNTTTVQENNLYDSNSSNSQSSEQLNKSNSPLQANSKNTEEKDDNLPIEFHLEWTQATQTMSLDDFWEQLFTTETSTSNKDLLKKYNNHLNNPIIQGEIVIVLNQEPSSEEDKSKLKSLMEEAQAASAELAKLNSDEVNTLSTYFHLLDHYASEALNSVQENGLPSDHYAYASMGVGALSSGIGQNLQSIKSVLEEINDTYISHVAMAKTTGGVNYGTFISERAKLFEKLDSQFIQLSNKGISIPVTSQVRSNLKLSTRSVLHNADEIINNGIVPNLGKRIGNVAIGISATKGVGYLGLGLSMTSATKSIYDACSINSNGECGKTTSREIAGFFGGLTGGNIGAALALTVVGVSASPVIAITSIVVGGAVGGILGTSAAKEVGESLYVTGEVLYEYITE